MIEHVKSPETDAETTNEVHIPESNIPICLSLRQHAEDLEAVYKRKHAGFVKPHVILTSECSLISYWGENATGEKFSTFSRAFTFLNEADEMVTVLFPLGLWEKSYLEK